MIPRAFNPLILLNKKKSIFLLGPRGTGKTALINNIESISKDGASKRRFNEKEIDYLKIDLLRGGDYQRYLSSPELLSKEIIDRIQRTKKRSTIVSIDEVQRVPSLLDEVHFLIEKFKGKLVFLLSGSSARKLKRGGANLLAGRAISCQLFPLSQLEIDLSLSRSLQFGTLPEIYLDSTGSEVITLESYVSTYLREEIQQESLVRGIDRFSKFLEFAAQTNGQAVNFTKLGKQLSVAGKTIAEYFRILGDTLIVRELSGWSESVRRQLQQASKFYFFDCGVLNALNGFLRIDLREGGYVFGNLFETFIINQLISADQYLSLGLRFYYWRDKNGNEVDLILARNAFEPLLALEIKAGSHPDPGQCSGFSAFKEDYPKVPRICACTSDRAYEEAGIRFVPWKELILSLETMI